MMDTSTTAQDIMRCDLCETAVVQMHCDTCLVNLCKACVGEHFSADVTKPHKIVDFKNRKSTTTYPACISHETELCEMHCKQCNIPVCISCLSSNQHLGHELSKLLQVLDEKKKKIIEEQIELKDKIYPTYQDIASNLQNRMSQLEKDYGDLSMAIIKHGEDWHRKVDKLVKKLKDEVDEMKHTELTTLQKQLDEAQSQISNIKAEISTLDIALDSYDISELLNVTSNIEKYKNPPAILPPRSTFIPEGIQEDELAKLFGALTTTSEEHGYSKKTPPKSPEAGSSPPVKQLLDEPETVTTINTGYDNPLNVACLNDEEIWTSGESSSTMKLFSIKRGSLLKSIKSRSGINPCDITVTKSGDLLYTDYDEKTVNIFKNEGIKIIIRLKHWKPDSICSTSSGDILVIMDSDHDKQSRIVRYSGSTEKQIIQFDEKGRLLFFPNDYNRITENRNLDICVSDGISVVVVVSQAGKLRFGYTGHTPAPRNQWFSPRGITTDSQSHILIADMSNDCVHIIDQDGQFLCFIVCKLIAPYGLCTDTNDNLFVAQYKNKQVRKIKYLQ